MIESGGGMALVWLIAGVLGLALGLMFYGGLFWTVRRALLSPRPGLWFVCSLALRTAVVLAGFWAIAGAQWQRLLMCLLGFLLARPLVARLTRPATAPTAARPGRAQV